jgi:hypothetical protein
MFQASQKKKKKKKKSYSNFSRHKTGKFVWSFIMFNVGGIIGFSTNVLFFEEPEQDKYLTF